MQELRKQVARVESEKRELQQSVHGLSQKCNFLQKETLQLDTKRFQAEKRVQECTSEITRLSDDLADKGYGLKSDSPPCSVLPAVILAAQGDGQQAFGDREVVGEQREADACTVGGHERDGDSKQHSPKGERQLGDGKDLPGAPSDGVGSDMPETPRETARESLQRREEYRARERYLPQTQAPSTDGELWDGCADGPVTRRVWVH